MPAPKKPKIRRIRVRRGHEKVSDGFDTRALEAKAAELLAREPAAHAPAPAPVDPAAHPGAHEAPKKPALTAAFAGVLNARGELALEGEAPKTPARRSSRPARRR